MMQPSALLFFLMVGVQARADLSQQGEWIYEDENGTPLQVVQMSDEEYRARAEKARQRAAVRRICYKDAKDVKPQECATYSSMECDMIRASKMD